jgi:hypothetical protein
MEKKIHNEHKEITFLSHKNHNPNFDILSVEINNNLSITYCYNIDNGSELMEYLKGENYNAKSKQKSYSRVYKADKIPAKYKGLFQELKNKYINNYKN